MDQTSFDRTSSRRRGRRRVLVAMLLGASVATVGAGAMSLAVFTDSKASTASWSTGTIILTRDTPILFTAAGILPGDLGSQDVVVSNTGTGDLRYALTSASVNTPVGKDLAGQIDFTIQTGTCASPTGSLYTGKLSGALFGDPTPGQQANDQGILAGNSQHLCFSWSLAKAFSDNTFQGVSTATTFTFAAEQTKNNP